MYERQPPVRTLLLYRCEDAIMNATVTDNDKSVSFICRHKRL